MTRAVKEGDDPRLMAPEAERSDYQTGSINPKVSVQKVEKQRLPWGVRFKAAKATASTPRFLGLAGIILLTISAGIIVAGIALPNRPQTSFPATPINAPSGVGRDGQGVPLDALQTPDPGSLKECTVKLGENWENYASIAAQAETKAYGLEITNATPDVIVSSLNSLPELQLKIRFLVLFSPSHPYSRSFQDAAALQTSLLDAAFSGMKLGFRLEGVVGIPSSDEQVENCNVNEEQQSSSDSGGGGSSKGAKSSGSFISQVLESVDTSSVINVIVCDPAGVNGATNILGSSSNSSSIHDDGTGEEDDHDHLTVLDRSIVLRRGALWQSRTSLVHQLGHYLGLPHPFPDTKTCKYDADTIVDTPQQYQSSTSCDTRQPVPLCDENLNLSLKVESYPMYGFMETTITSTTSADDITTNTSSNNSIDGGGCRKHFTPGQVLRARAMLRMLRPELHKAASNNATESMERLPWAQPGSGSVVAFQSALSSAAVVARQLAVWQSSAITAAAVTASTLAVDPQQQNNANVLFPNNEKAANRLTSALDQALQATGESRGSTSLEECSCLGPDSNGNAFWTGKLDASYSVDAVRIVQPWEIVVNATYLANFLRLNAGSQQSPSDLRQTSSPPSSSPSTSPSSPQTEGISTSNRTPPRSPSSTSPSPTIAVPTVEIRIGNDPNFYQNKICEAGELPGNKLVQTISCRKSLSGQFITVRWTNWQKNTAKTLTSPVLIGTSSITAAAAAAGAGAVQPPMCLCDVAALSHSSPPVRENGVPIGNIPGALLNTTVTTDVDARESSSLASCSSSLGGAGGGSNAGFPDVNEAYWSMPLTATSSSSSKTTTTDPVLINGVRFSIPNTCSGLTLRTPKTPPPTTTTMPTATSVVLPAVWQPPAWNTTALKCGDGSSSAGNVTLNIYIFPAATAASAEEYKLFKERKEEYLCARNVQVPPGQVVDITCTKTLEGHVLTFFLASSSPPLPETTTNGAATASAITAPPTAAPSGAATSVYQNDTTVPLLELCGVQPIGGISLINSDLIAAEQQTMLPEKLMPMFSLAVDGNIGTCIIDTTTTTTAAEFPLLEPSGNAATNEAGNTSEVPSTASPTVEETTPSPTSSSTLWQTGFNGEYLIVGVEITTKTGGIAPRSSNSAAAAAALNRPAMQLALIDSAGREVVVKDIFSSTSTTSKPVSGQEGDTEVISVEVIPPVYAKTVKISGFTSLCEVSFTAASRTPK